MSARVIWVRPKCAYRTQHDLTYLHLRLHNLEPSISSRVFQLSSEVSSVPIGRDCGALVKVGRFARRTERGWRMPAITKAFAISWRAASGISFAMRRSSYLAHGGILKGEFGLKATDSQNGRLRNTA
jgi:hypothetical protein